MPTAKRCRKCGSSNCGLDATAGWDVDAQAFVLRTTFDNTWCDDCGADDPGLFDVEVSEDQVDNFQLEIWRGDDNKGPITRLVVACTLTDPDEDDFPLLYVFEEDADIARLLSVARQSERSDPNDDKLPSHQAIITAALSL